MFRSRVLSFSLALIAAIALPSMASAAPPLPTSATLTADVPSPQEQGTVVTFTATASGGGGLYEYEFGYIVGYTWTVLQGYSPRSTFVWETHNYIPTAYAMRVKIRNVGSTAASEVEAEYQPFFGYMISDHPIVSSVAISAVGGAPQDVGTAVRVTGTASGGSGLYEYEFGHGNQFSWTVLRGYSQDKDFIWDTGAHAAGYVPIQVRARNVGSTATLEAGIGYLPPIGYLLGAPTGSADITLTSDVASPQVPATTVTFTGNVTAGGGPYEYEFRSQPVGGAWTTEQAYSATATWAWNTTGLTGGYTVQVWARTQGSSGSAEHIANMTYVLAHPASTVTMSPDVATPQVVGATITWTATGAAGTGSYEYEFWTVDPLGDATIRQAYSATNTWAWNTTGEALGGWEVFVRVRHTGSTENYEGHAQASYMLTTSAPAAPTPTLAVAPVSPVTEGTPVTLTGSATGGSGSYEYQFWMQSMSNNDIWVMLQDYSTTDNFLWATAGDIGLNTVRVHTRNVGHASNWESHDELAFMVGPSDIDLTYDLTSPQENEVHVLLTAAAVGAPIPYEYAFYLAGPSTGGNTVLQQAFSLADVWHWVPGQNGTYTITVETRHPLSTEPYDTQKLDVYEMLAPACTPYVAGYTIPPGGYDPAVVQQPGLWMSGPVVLQRALAKWGSTKTADDLATSAGTTDPAGTTIGNLASAATGEGVTVVNTTLLWTDLATHVESADTALIARTTCGTFYLVQNVSGDTVEVDDVRSPGTVPMPVADFQTQWTGEVLILTRPGTFLP